MKLKRNRKPPVCPGCLSKEYVTKHQNSRYTTMDWWCARCNHWFGR